MMQRLVLASLLLAACPAQPQDARDLVGRFGRPVLEQYHLKPDVSLVVTYGPTHVACELRLEPWRDLIGWIHPLNGGRTEGAQAGQPAVMPREVADRILNELVPASARIGRPLVMHQQMSRAAADITEYQNVRISRLTDEGLPAKNNVTGIVIKWKLPECREPN